MGSFGVPDFQLVMTVGVTLTLSVPLLPIGNKHILTLRLHRPGVRLPYGFKVLHLLVNRDFSGV